MSFSRVCYREVQPYPADVGVVLAEGVDTNAGGGCRRGGEDQVCVVLAARLTTSNGD